MKPAQPRSPEQVRFAAVLLLLAALGLLLLFKDLSRRPARPSRIGWPPPAPAPVKP